MNTEQKKIKLMLDYMQGPIWISDAETGEPMTDIPVVDNDIVLTKLNKRCCELYSSCYEFDSHNKACWFNKEKELKIKCELLSLLEQIKKRLYEINDGSFTVEDMETSRLNSL